MSPSCGPCGPGAAPRRSHQPMRLHPRIQHSLPRAYNPTRRTARAYPAYSRRPAAPVRTHTASHAASHARAPTIRSLAGPTWAHGAHPSHGCAPWRRALRAVRYRRSILAPTRQARSRARTTSRSALGWWATRRCGRRRSSSETCRRSTSTTACARAWRGRCAPMPPGAGHVTCLRGTRRRGQLGVRTALAIPFAHVGGQVLVVVLTSDKVKRSPHMRSAEPSSTTAYSAAYRVLTAAQRRASVRPCRYRGVRSSFARCGSLMGQPGPRSRCGHVCLRSSSTSLCAHPAAELAGPSPRDTSSQPTLPCA